MRISVQRVSAAELPCVRMQNSVCDDPFIPTLITSQNIHFWAKTFHACLSYQQNTFTFLSSLSVNKVHFLLTH